MRLLKLLLLTLLGAGCAHGALESRPGMGNGAFGEMGTVLIRGAPPSPSTLAYTVELLAVQDTALLVRANNLIALAPLRVIERASFGDVRTSNPRASRGALRRLARYPEGLTEERLSRLLRAYGQEELATLSGPKAPAPSLAAFLETAREAAQPFLNIDAAVQAGYRRLGPSFPGMGEHWINPGLVVQGVVDPLRPSMLCYARVGNEARLVAVAFTLPLEADESPPDFPAGPHGWHDHSNAVDEESLLLTHPDSHAGAAGPRLAMFHAWIGLENPAGPLAQNNWRLPFVQAGLQVDGLSPSADAGRALSLWSGESGFMVRLLSTAANLEPAEEAALSSTVRKYRERARGWVEAVDEEAVDEADLESLEGIWASFWSDVQHEVRDVTWQRLAILR